MYDDYEIKAQYRTWRAPDYKSECKYHEPEAKSLHNHKQRFVRPKIMSNILENIGNTPLVAINNIGRFYGLECEILAKCEFFSSGGSIKDRTALRMVEEAERDGVLKAGDIIIEPSSGNTGIGLAVVAAVKGYRCIVVMPDKVSREKYEILRSLGAEIVWTPTVNYDCDESYIGVAKRILEQTPNSIILNQYTSVYNPLEHYDQTAEEILDSCDGKVEMFVAGAGTGGTLTGISRKFRERCPSCKIIGVDAEGSIIAQPDSLNKVTSNYYIEGVGHDFVPTVCDRRGVDRWYKCNDSDSFNMARTLIREEGILCGGSSGSVMVCAVKAIKDFGLKKGDRCVVVFADSVRNYLSKFLNDDWMIQNGFMASQDVNSSESSWWWKTKVSDLHLDSPLTVPENTTVQNCIEMLNKKGVNQVLVIDDSEKILGLNTVENMLSQMVKGVKNCDPVSKVKYVNYSMVSMNDTLGTLSHHLVNDPCTLVVHDLDPKGGEGKAVHLGMVSGVATHLGVLSFIAASGPTNRNGDVKTSPDSSEM